MQADSAGFLAGAAPACWSRVAALSTTYEPRHPAQGVRYQIVHDHFETFRTHAASLRDGDGVPRFVEQEFRDLLQCGWLAGGFARFRRGDCGLDRLVPFSCKGRALCPACPRCGGRLRLITLIEEVALVGRILRHMGVPTEIPAPRPARAPPLPAGIPAADGWDEDALVFDPCS